MNEPIKPKKPVKPKEPQEITTYNGSRPQFFLDRYTPYSIPEIVESIKNLLPKGAVFDLSKVKIEVEFDHDENNSCAYYDEFQKITYVDKNYKKKYVKYLKKLKKYEEDLAEYSAKHNQYIVDLAAYKEFLKNKEIEDARKVLERHGIK